MLKEPQNPGLLREHRRDLGRCVRCSAPAEAYIEHLELDRDEAARRAKAEGVTVARFVTKGLCTACLDDIRPERRLGGVAILDLGACARCEKPVSAADRKDFDGPILTLGSCGDCGSPVVADSGPEALDASTALVCRRCVEVGGQIETLDIGAPAAGDCHDFRAWVQYKGIQEHDEAGGCRECSACTGSGCKTCPACLEGLGRGLPFVGSSRR